MKNDKNIYRFNRNSIEIHSIENIKFNKKNLLNNFPIQFHRLGNLKLNMKNKTNSKFYFQFTLTLFKTESKE